MAWNKVGKRLLAVYTDRWGQGRPGHPPALATSAGSVDEGARTPDYAALRKRIGKPAAQHRARILLTMG